MSSVSKTLELLAFFSALRPELGLSELSKLAQRDKATTYRHLQALEAAGLVEQISSSKRYRLGPALLQLAQIRETTVPRKAAAAPAMTELAEITGETTHVSVLSGSCLYPLAACESPRHSIRAVIDVQTYPLHATASGLCALAFGPSVLIKVALKNLQRLTPNTPKTAEELEHAINVTRDAGLSRTNESFEAGVRSIAAPLFDQTGLFAGAVSVASVAARYTPESERCIREQLMLASRTITRSWGGIVPDTIEAAWTRFLSRSSEVENTECTIQTS